MFLCKWVYDIFNLLNFNDMKKVISILFCAFVLSGCNSGAVHENKLKIGVLTPLSGPVASFGEEAKEILDKTLAKEFPGDMDIELIYGDSQCSGQVAVTSYRKLVDIDKVDMILGGFCSSESLAIAPMLVDDNMLVVSGVSTHPDLRFASPNFFSLSFSDINLASGVAQQAEFSDRVVILTEQNDWNVGLQNLVELELGDQLVAAEIFEKGATNMRNSIVKALNAKPEILILNPNAGQTASMLIKQLAEYKDQLHDVQILAHTIYLTPEVLESADLDIIEGMIVVDIPFGEDSFEFQDFKRSFTKEVTNHTDYIIASTHDALVNLVNVFRSSKPGQHVSNFGYANLDGFTSDGKSFLGKAFLKDIKTQAFIIQNGQLVKK